MTEVDKIKQGFDDARRGKFASENPDVDGDLDWLNDDDGIDT